MHTILDEIHTLSTNFAYDDAFPIIGTSLRKQKMMIEQHECCECNAMMNRNSLFVFLFLFLQSIVKSATVPFKWLYNLQFTNAKVRNVI